MVARLADFTSPLMCISCRTKWANWCSHVNIDNHSVAVVAAAMRPSPHSLWTLHGSPVGWLALHIICRTQRSKCYVQSYELAPKREHLEQTRETIWLVQKTFRRRNGPMFRLYNLLKPEYYVDCGFKKNSWASSWKINNETFDQQSNKIKFELNVPPMVHQFGKSNRQSSIDEKPAPTLSMHHNSLNERNILQYSFKCVKVHICTYYILELATKCHAFSNPHTAKGCWQNRISFPRFASLCACCVCVCMSACIYTLPLTKRNSSQARALAYPHVYTYSTYFV